MKKYKCIRDCQGGKFCVGNVYTAREWFELATGWRDSDESFENENDRREWEEWGSKCLTGQREQEIIDYIAEVWQLEIIEEKEN